MHKPELLSAGIVRDLRFASEGDLHEYMDKRLSNGSRVELVDSCTDSHGFILARILCSYNSSPLIKLYY